MPSAPRKRSACSQAYGGMDSAFSMEPGEFAALRVETERACQAPGRVTYWGTEAEENSHVFRRSVYVAVDVQAGTVLSRENVRVVQPGLRQTREHMGAVLDRRVARAAAAGTPITWDLMQ